MGGRSLSRKQKSLLAFFENFNENNLAEGSSQFYLNSGFLGTSGKDLLVTGGCDRLPAALLDGAKVLTGRPVRHIREQAGMYSIFFHTHPIRRGIVEKFDCTHHRPVLSGAKLDVFKTSPFEAGKVLDGQDFHVHHCQYGCI